MLVIEGKIKTTESFSGIDSPDNCKDKKHFNSYNKEITYNFNSRGFRDSEWPEDLSNVVWCVGDSFTVGLGQPFEETWPQVLGRKLGKRCINVGEDGGSNDRIQSRVNEIIKKHNPGLVVVMWSYLHRRFVNGENVHHNKEDFGAVKDMENFIRNYQLCDKKTKIVHSIIPMGLSPTGWTYVLQKNHIHDMIVFPQLDYARDYHHFDIKTSEFATDLMIKKINAVDKSYR